jgi:hypothetical protein
VASQRSFPHLAASSCALQGKTQAARPRYRSDTEQSAEGINPPSALAPIQVCPLRCRSRFTTSRFMASPKTAAPSSARRSQAAGAVVAGTCRTRPDVPARRCVRQMNITLNYAKCLAPLRA